MSNGLALCLAVLATCTPAAAAGLDIVRGLGDVIAAEQFCGLTYDQAAIESFVAEHVDAGDLDFTGQLKGMVYLAERQQAAMSNSAATAHCAQVRRLAKTYGFTT